MEVLTSCWRGEEVINGSQSLIKKIWLINIFALPQCWNAGANY